MIIQKNEKVHIITRRLFEGDLRRHFVGIVMDASEHAIKVRGFVYVFDEGKNEFVRRDGERQRLFSITDADLVINLLPSGALISNIRYQLDEQRNRIVTDGETFTLNINEFSARV